MGLGVGGINWKIGNDIYTLLYIKKITTKDILYGRGNSSHYSVTAYTGKESRVHICITDSLGCTPKTNIKLKIKYTPIKLQGKMGIHPSRGKKKKKNSGSPCSREISSCFQHQPQRRLRKKAERLELRTWLLRSLFSKGQHILVTRQPIHRHRDAVFSIFPKPQPRRPSQPSGGGTALRERSREGPARADLPWRAQAATRAALRVCQPDPSPPRSPGSPAAAPALGTTTLAPGRQEMTRKLDATAPEAQNNG